jgi:hypothetical protein
MSAAREHGLDEDHEWARPPEGGWTAEDELDPATGTYGLTGIRHDLAKPTEPLPLTVDLAAVDRRR